MNGFKRIKDKALLKQGSRTDSIRHGSLISKRRKFDKLSCQDEDPPCFRTAVEQTQVDWSDWMEMESRTRNPHKKIDTFQEENCGSRNASPSLEENMQEFAFKMNP
jgi:hypothetical protein